MMMAGGRAMTGNTPEIAFLVDHMLVKLGKYLRILGYNAEWDLARRTHELILRANAEDRIFLTRNLRLANEYPPARKPFVLSTDDPAEQLQAVVREFGLDPQKRLFSKCIRCNVALDLVADKTTIRERVHPNVYERHERFYTCPRCGTVFWHGSHVRNTCRKLGVKQPNIEHTTSNNEHRTDGR
jgi:uncharacterized protein